MKKKYNKTFKIFHKTKHHTKKKTAVHVYNRIARRPHFLSPVQFCKKWLNNSKNR